MAKAGKNNQEAPVADTGEQTALGAADADVAVAPVSKDSLPTPPAETETATDAATLGKPDDLVVKPVVQFVQLLRVVSKRENFRRAGIWFGTEPVVLDLADLTAEQFDLIIADPMLEAALIDAEN